MVIISKHPYSYVNHFQSHLISKMNRIWLRRVPNKYIYLSESTDQHHNFTVWRICSIGVPRESGGYPSHPWIDSRPTKHRLRGSGSSSGSTRRLGKFWTGIHPWCFLWLISWDSNDIHRCFLGYFWGCMGLMIHIHCVLLGYFWGCRSIKIILMMWRLAMVLFSDFLSQEFSSMRDVTIKRTSQSWRAWLASLWDPHRIWMMDLFLQDTLCVSWWKDPGLWSTPHLFPRKTRTNFRCPIERFPPKNTIWRFP